MKSQTKSAIAPSVGAALVALAVGFWGGDLLSRDTTTTIRSPVAGAELLGQARTDNRPCVADPTNLCLPAVGDSAESPGSPRMQTMCRPAGIFGQHCFRRTVRMRFKQGP